MVNYGLAMLAGQNGQFEHEDFGEWNGIADASLPQHSGSVDSNKDS
jgi:hypothetical protein